MQKKLGNELRPYQICKQCIMDTTDPDIYFDSEGICCYCHLMAKKAKIYSEPENVLKEKLEKVIFSIKKEGQNKKYDCIIGVSGGIDSTYVAYLVKKLGLRPLAVHLDNGWDTEIAVSNINKTLKILNIELYTYVIDWEEFKNLQLAFLKASTPDSEIPTDHAIYAVLRKIAAQKKIKYIIDGVNFASETIMPKAWSQGYSDWGYIKLVNKLYGNKKLKKYPHYSFWNLFYYKRIKKQVTVSILNYIKYNKLEAKQTLIKELNWQDYGGKHYESLYTRFFQAYILPRKFGFDKRRAHLSTLINSGQISRNDALEQIKNALYSKDLLQEHLEFVIKKFGITKQEFDDIINLSAKRYSDYRPQKKLTIEKIEEMIFYKYNIFRLILKIIKRYFKK